MLVWDIFFIRIMEEEGYRKLWKKKYFESCLWYRFELHLDMSFESIRLIYFY